MVGLGDTGVLPKTCIVVIHLTRRRTPCGDKRTPPLQECLVGSKVFAEGGGGARLFCLSIPRNPTVRQTFMAGCRVPMLSESWQSCVRRWGTMGRCLREVLSSW